MNEELEDQFLTKLDPAAPASEESLRRIEAMTWQRLEERHSARARSRRGAIVVALVVVLGVGVVVGATAITGSPWLDHVMHFIHMHLKMIHDLFDGSHR